MLDKITFYCLSISSFLFNILFLIICDKFGNIFLEYLQILVYTNFFICCFEHLEVMIDAFDSLGEKAGRLWICEHSPQRNVRFMKKNHDRDLARVHMEIWNDLAEKLCVITASLPGQTGLEWFQKALKSKFDFI